jgi:DNA-binding transcriptional regulator LsrR (DeoR family)
MRAPSDPTPDDLLATAGGNATAGGVTFQAEVGAGFAVRLLAERRLNERFGLGDVSIRSLRFETEAPVDDILIETDAAGWIFTQAKSSLTLSTTSGSELGSVADQMVRQWHACAQGTGERGWDRPLDPNRDRILIAVGRKTPATVTDLILPTEGATFYRFGSNSAARDTTPASHA